MHFVRVDLNSVLYKTERILVKCATLLGFDEAEAFLNAAKATLERLEFAHGVSVDDEATGNRGFQWAYPNMWAPVAFWIYKGVEAVGLSVDGMRVKEKYGNTLERVFEKTGKLWEKYNVLTGEVSDSEYLSPSMMGWTAGVYRYFEEN